MLLSCLLRVGNYEVHKEPHCRQYGIHGVLRWDVWFLRELELHCSLIISELTGGDSVRIPERGQTMTVTAGKFEWPIVTKYRGEYRILFDAPLGTAEVHGLQRPTGKWYVVTVRLAYKGLSVYKERFLVSAFGGEIDWRDFRWEQYDI